jgi:hypothetical protein
VIQLPNESIAKIATEPRQSVLLLPMMLAGIVFSCLSAPAQAAPHQQPVQQAIRAALPPGTIQHVLVIELENQNYAMTFGPASPAKYLNSKLLKRGELIVRYFATSHASLGNYLSQVSGQGSTEALNNDCIDVESLSHPPLRGRFTDIRPGNDAADVVSFPGQVVGDGCVFPSPSANRHGALTIGDQLDALASQRAGAPVQLNWRGYAEDMGDYPARDYGTADLLGGTDCAHPPVGGVDLSNTAAANDQYATRHNPFMYFHSVIDDSERCNAHVVPLGKLALGSRGTLDQFQGHLFEDLRRTDTTPRFMFVTPNLCNDAHDPICVGPNVERTRDAAGNNIGGMVAADLWLKHWMPMIFDSPAYRNGSMLIVLTFDEAEFDDSRACESVDPSACRSPLGPNLNNPGFSAVIALTRHQQRPTKPFSYPGGGQVGAVLFNNRFIRPGTINTRGQYNHFSALRSYEDLLGITTGGDDGLGHLGFAALKGLQPFGPDVFNRSQKR